MDLGCRSEDDRGNTRRVIRLIGDYEGEGVEGFQDPLEDLRTETEGTCPECGAASDEECEDDCEAQFDED